MAHILCAGIAVLDEVFRVQEFPMPDTKVEASEFITIGGGCAANAAVAIARLGGKVRFAAPLGGPAGEDAIGDRLVEGLQSEGVDCVGCVRVPAGALRCRRSSSMRMATAPSRLFATTASTPWCRTIPTRLVAGMDAVLVDNRFDRFRPADLPRRRSPAAFRW